jgi:hypothetical protein
MKQVSNPSKQAIVKLLALSVIIIFSFTTVQAQVSPKWTSFNIAVESKNSVKLSWSVEQQKNTSGYIIEKSSDMKTWKAIAGIDNTSGENSAAYSFNDKNLTEGMNYYRVRQQDIHGNISYSVLKVFNNNAKSMAAELAYLSKQKAH